MSSLLMSCLQLYMYMYFDFVKVLAVGREGAKCMSIIPCAKYEWLTLKAPIMTAADDIHKYFFIVFQRK